MENAAIVKYNTNEEKAIQYVMEYYHVSRLVACEFYWHEVEEYIQQNSAGTA